MVFSSHVFLFAFLPLFLLLYFLSPRGWRNVVALLASWCFYAWGAPGVLPILILSCVADYLLSRGMARRPEWKTVLLVLSLILNIGLLAYYKYANFFMAEANRLLGFFQIEPAPWTAIALPIGISFFTFQKISYMIDVHRDHEQPARSFVEYALFVALFPQLIAGPIIRYHEIAARIRERRESLNDVFEGTFRFTRGLARKILLANPLGEAADQIFKIPGAELSPFWAWLGIICYAFQIYMDFAGYSDMAIGLGRIMGFRIADNFNMPYISANFTEFWRRWHISLGNWMKEYLYIPLGGNRLGAARMYFNLWIVFLLSGLWHGAAWNFVVWGAWNGLFLVLDKLFWLRAGARLPRFVNIAITFVLVLVGWVFFRAANLPQALDYLAAMFNVLDGPQSNVAFQAMLPNRTLFVLAIALAMGFLPAWSAGMTAARGRWETLSLSTRRVGKSLMTLVLFILSAAAVTNSAFNPFIYFRF